MVGDLPGTVLAFKEAAPLLVVPAKAALAFPLVYHYAGELLLEQSSAVLFNQSVAL